MPALPPWLIPATPAEYYAKGIGLGIQQAQQQAAAAHAAQQLQMEAERAAVRDALAQQELALRAQEQASSEELVRSRVAEASRRAAAQREYQTRAAAGEDPMKLLMELGPSMGSEQTAQAAAIRYQLEQAKRRTLPGGPIQGKAVMGPDGKPIEGLIGVESATGQGYTIHSTRPLSPKMTDYQRDLLTERSEKRIDALVKENEDLNVETPDPKWSPRRLAKWTAGRKRILEEEQKIAELGGMGQASATGGAATGAPSLIYNPQTKSLERVGGGPSATPPQWGQSVWGALRQGIPRAMEPNIPAGAMVLRPG